MGFLAKFGKVMMARTCGVDIWVHLAVWMEFGSMFFRLEMENSKEEEPGLFHPGPSAIAPKGGRYSAVQCQTALVVVLGR